MQCKKKPSIHIPSPALPLLCAVPVKPTISEYSDIRPRYSTLSHADNTSKKILTSTQQTKEENIKTNMQHSFRLLTLFLNNPLLSLPLTPPRSLTASSNTLKHKKKNYLY
jgi:hypothetical protein